jgi:hypothetical protein
LVGHGEEPPGTVARHPDAMITFALILLIAAAFTPWRQLSQLTRGEWAWAALVCCTMLAVFSIMNAPYSPPGSPDTERMGTIALGVLAALLLWGVARAGARRRAGLSVRPILPVLLVGALPLLLIGIIWLSRVA